MKFRPGDTVYIKQRGLIGYGETGTVIEEKHGPQFDSVEYDTVVVKLKSSGFVVRYSIDCVDKMAGWRSIDDV